MSDIALIINDDNEFDIALGGGGDLRTDDGLETAVAVSLFTDARAPEDARLPGDAADRRGCWMDATLGDGDDGIGSLLWLLHREKTTPDVPVRARQYALDALQWLLDDHVASAVEVEAERVGINMLALVIRITRPDGKIETYHYDYNWQAQELAR
jgi:phage gp46-like protein